MTPVEYMAVFAAVAAGTAAAGTYMTVESNNQQAKAIKRNAEIEAEQYAEERKAATLRADQEVAATMRAANDAVSASNALRASRGLDPFSPTGRTLSIGTLDEAAADLETIKANAGVADSRLQRGATASGMRASQGIAAAGNASTAAVISGVGSIARTGYSYMSGSGRGL